MPSFTFDFKKNKSFIFDFICCNYLPLRNNQFLRYNFLKIKLCP